MSKTEKIAECVGIERQNCRQRCIFLCIKSEKGASSNMARKQMFEGGTKQKILQVGTQVFLENGYDATGIRTIMRRVGADVGAFYYYYPPKQALFLEVLEAVFAPYEEEAAVLMRGAAADPLGALLHLFEYMRISVQQFRAQYAGRLHMSARWAMRERVLAHLCPYVAQILRILVEQGARPRMSIDRCAESLSYGVGSLLLDAPSSLSQEEVADLMQVMQVMLALGVEPAAGEPNEA